MIDKIVTIRLLWMIDKMGLHWMIDKMDSIKIGSNCILILNICAFLQK